MRLDSNIYIGLLKMRAKKLVFYTIIYTSLCLNSYPFEFLSSNGENYFKFVGEKNRVEKVDLDFNKKSYDIDFIKIGFFINGVQYELGEEDYSLELLDDSNIIKITGEFEDVKYEINLYSSVINKDVLVFNTQLLTFKKLDDVSIYFYIKPKEIGQITQMTDKIVYNDINFSGKNLKVYRVENTEYKEKKLKNINDEKFINKNQGIFIISPLETQKDGESYFILHKKGSYTSSVTNEKKYWETILSKHKEKALYSSLYMFLNKGLVVDTSGESPIIDMNQTMKFLELSLLKKDYAVSKKIIEDLLILTKDQSQGIIPSNFMDINGNTIKKTDNYGVHNSFYRRFTFLKLYLTYLLETGDKELYEKTYPKVKNNLIDWLEKKIDSTGVVSDSGNDRIGEDGYKKFVETQYEAYRSFKLLSLYLGKNNIKEEKYKKIAEKLKEILILYYVDGVYIVDYPFAKELNPKNIFYVDEDLFFNNADYYKALQKNIEILKKQPSSLIEKITFVNYLYDKKYFLMADSLREDIEKQLEGYKGIEILQNDINLLLNYLIMKEKGEKYGLNK